MLTTKEVKKKLSCRPTDKFYLIKWSITDTGISVERVAQGFNAYELLGILEEIQQDIIKQLRGQSEKPEQVTKLYIKESK